MPSIVASNSRAAIIHTKNGWYLVRKSDKVELAEILFIIASVAAEFIVSYKFFEFSEIKHRGYDLARFSAHKRDKEEKEYTGANSKRK